MKIKTNNIINIWRNNYLYLNTFKNDNYIKMKIQRNLQNSYWSEKIVSENFIKYNTDQIEVINHQIID